MMNVRCFLYFFVFLGFSCSTHRMQGTVMDFSRRLCVQTLHKAYEQFFEGHIVDSIYSFFYNGATTGKWIDWDGWERGKQYNLSLREHINVFLVRGAATGQPIDWENWIGQGVFNRGKHRHSNWVENSVDTRDDCKKSLVPIIDQLKVMPDGTEKSAKMDLLYAEAARCIHSVRNVVIKKANNS